ncbi:hypothetical protein QUF64_05785 [Anaerolineales bacterium HSG6]|nr:hypothetical protein [Anaerolineales bacterium HSG6]
MYNLELLAQAKQILSAYKKIYWVIGGACSGKSTLCRMIAQKIDIPVYDMDEYIFGTYMPRYTEVRHPVSKAWFSAENGLDWVLSLSGADFEVLNRAANAEYIDLFAQDVRRYSVQDWLLVDGGISYPAILAQAFPVGQIACLYLPPHESRQIWETAVERQPMREMILDLPEGDKKWQTFLGHDKHIAEQCWHESKAENIPLFVRDGRRSTEQLVQKILGYFGLR